MTSEPLDAHLKPSLWCLLSWVAAFAAMTLGEGDAASKAKPKGDRGSSPAYSDEATFSND